MRSKRHNKKTVVTLLFKVNVIVLLSMFLHFNVIMPYLDVDNTFVELIDIEEEEESQESEEKIKDKEDKVVELYFLKLATENKTASHLFGGDINMLLETHCEVFTPPPELL